MKKNRPSRPLTAPKPPSLLPLALGLFFLVMATFWPCTNNSFINYDDDAYVTKNDFIKEGLTAQSISWAFTTGEQANWHPLTWITHMIDFKLYGLKPAGHHFTNVLLHSINAVLLFLVLEWMTGARWKSLAAAALFALHPLRVESVAWVAERKDVLSVFFFLLVLLSYAQYCRRRSGKAAKPADPNLAPSAKLARPSAKEPEKSESRPQKSFLIFYFLSLFFFALGLMSKPMLVTLPFVLLLLDYWPLRRFTTQKPWRLFAEKIPFLALAAASSIVTVIVQKSGGAFHADIPLALRLQTAVVSYAKYAGKTFWPVNLSIQYPYPHHWPLSTLIIAGSFLIAVTILSVAARRSYPWLLTGWLWFLGMLVPVIGLLQVGLQSMADRYSYLPAIGLAIMVVWSVGALAKMWRLQPLALGSASVAVCLALILATRHQVGLWKNSGTLFEHALEVTGDNSIALMRLGDYYRSLDRMDDAIKTYRKAIRVDPKMEEPEVNLGVLLYVSGRKDEGIQELEAAVKQVPNSAMVRENLGLFLLGQGRLDEAEAHMTRALELKEDYVEAHVVMGDIYAKKGQKDKAIAHYRRALELRPNFAPAKNRLQSLDAN